MDHQIKNEAVTVSFTNWLRAIASLSQLSVSYRSDVVGVAQGSKMAGVLIFGTDFILAKEKKTSLKSISAFLRY